MIKEVYVIFKTHLDIGFTDYAENVVNKYIDEYIPNAIKTGYELREKNIPFVWTTGSWLIWEALKTDDGTLEKAINDGIIAWHALPFTSHTELMSKKLFEYGLSLSQRLDKRFGKKTDGAKMTDVPGHTYAMIPSLNKYGVKFLHIGVNEATPMPKTPEIFRWRYKDSEIYVMYDGSYGNTTVLGDKAIMFAHTMDNRGAQSAEAVEKLYKSLKKEYPDAVIKAATLSDLVPILQEQENLPVFEKEIGDTWIHGAGTDPKKVGQYRELLRYIEDIDLDKADLTDNLLLVPEHTWGMACHLYFDYRCDYELSELEKYKNNKDRLIIERSWQEQRDYLDKAAEVLDYKLDYKAEEPDLTGYTEAEIKKPCFTLSWELFDEEDLLRYMNKYLRINMSTVCWAYNDFLREGLKEYDGGIFNAEIQAAYEKDGTYIYRLEFDDGIKKKYGLPTFWAKTEGNRVEIIQLKRKPIRVPNAFWLKFNGFGEGFEIRKMGEWIKPCDVVGSPLICATDYGIKNDKAEIESRDACLVAPYGRRLYDFELNPKGEDMYFNLYNNVWSTNFPLWYSDPTKYEFIIKER